MELLVGIAVLAVFVLAWIDFPSLKAKVWHAPKGRRR